MSSLDMVIDVVIRKQRKCVRGNKKTDRIMYSFRPERLQAIYFYNNLSSLACLTAVLRLFTPSLE